MRQHVRLSAVVRAVPYLLLLLLVFAVIVEAQEGDAGDTEGAQDEQQAEVVELTIQDANASIGLQKTVQAMANVDVEIDGTLYRMKVPVAVTVDTQAALQDALLQVDNTRRVGVLEVEILDIEEYGDEFALDRFQTLAPSSPENKLAVVQTRLTNLGNEPFEPWDLDIAGVDDVGSLYERTDWACDTINPNATQTCVWVFDVSEEIAIVGIDVQVPDRKVLLFEEAESASPSE